jgi:hypothetical protein
VSNTSFDSQHILRLLHVVVPFLFLAFHYSLFTTIPINPWSTYLHKVFMHSVVALIPDGKHASLCRTHTETRSAQQHINM